MPCRRKKEFQRHTAAMSAGLTTACRFPVKKKKQNGEKREEKSKKERPDTKSDEGKDKQGREIPAKGKRRGKKQTGRREGKDDKPLAKNPPRGKAGRSQCRTVKTTTSEQQRTGKREKTERNEPDGGKEKTIKKQKDDSEKSAAGKSRQVPMPDSENDDRRTTTDRQKGKDGKKSKPDGGKSN